MQMFRHNLHMYLPSRHPGASGPIQKVTKLTIEIWSQIPYRRGLYLASDYFFLMGKSTKKHEFVQHHWRILRPKLETLS